MQYILGDFESDFTWFLFFIYLVFLQFYSQIEFFWLFFYYCLEKGESLCYNIKCLNVRYCCNDNIWNKIKVLNKNVCIFLFQISKVMIDFNFKFIFKVLKLYVV